MNSTLTKGALGVSALALALTACSGSSGGTNQPTGDQGSTGGSPSGSNAAVTETAAAGLRAALDSLLRQHVDLTANTVLTVVAQGSLTDPEVQGAIKALDGNTVALGDAVGSIYGAAARTQFLKMWRAHIGFFVTYTKGDLTNNDALKKQANKQLDGYRQDFGKFIAGATGNALPADAVAQELLGHVQTLEAAIDAITSKAPDAASKVQDAAMHMDGTAAALAGGIASAKSLAGKVDGSGSELRAALTGLLTQHVAQTAVAVQTVVQTGSLTDKETQGAIKALDDNTVALGDAVGSIYGDAAKTAFLKLWRAHIGFFVTYTKGDLTNSAALKKQANKQLDGYRKDFGDFIAGATNNALTSDQVASELSGHVQTLEAAIDAITSKAPDAGAKVGMAMDHMLGTAQALAKAIADTQQDKFTS